MNYPSEKILPQMNADMHRAVCGFLTVRDAIAFTQISKKTLAYMKLIMKLFPDVMSVEKFFSNVYLYKEVNMVFNAEKNLADGLNGNNIAALSEFVDYIYSNTAIEILFKYRFAGDLPKNWPFAYTLTLKKKINGQWVKPHPIVWSNEPGFAKYIPHAYFNTHLIPYHP